MAYFNVAEGKGGDEALERLLGEGMIIGGNHHKVERAEQSRRSAGVPNINVRIPNYVRRPQSNAGGKVHAFDFSMKPTESSGRRAATAAKSISEKRSVSFLGERDRPAGDRNSQQVTLGKAVMEEGADEEGRMITEGGWGGTGGGGGGLGRSKGQHQHNCWGLGTTSCPNSTYQEEREESASGGGNEEDE